MPSKLYGKSKDAYRKHLKLTTYVFEVWYVNNGIRPWLLKTPVVGSILTAELAYR